MVLKGQFLERMTTFQSHGLMLEGLFHEGRGIHGAVIACPHPVFGGSMDSAPCAELAWAITRTGAPTLRFNYRGVGASHGKGHVTQPHAQEELQDLRSAVQWLSETTRKERVHVAGYSFGAWLASYLALEEPRRIERLVLVAPPTRVMPFDFVALSQRQVETLIIIPAEDRYVDHAGVAALEQLPGLKVLKIPDADHGFLRGLAYAGRAAAEHLAEDSLGPLVDIPEPEDGPPLELDI